MKTTKRIITLLLVLSMVLAAICVASTTFFAKELDAAQVGGNDYPYSGTSSPVVDRWNFYSLNCTSFCAWRLNNNNGVAFNNYYLGVHWGNAKNWDDAARQVGIAVNSTPAEGAIACWNKGTYGHVAWVSRVNSNNTVDIEEYNYSTKYKYGTRNLAVGNPDCYIHIKDLNAPVIVPTLPTEPIPEEHKPIGYTDACEGKPGVVHVRGWAFDPENTSANIAVHIYIGGKAGDPNAEAHEIVACNGGRSDVDNAYHCGDHHAFYADITTSKRGKQEVHVYALNADRTNNTAIGDFSVEIMPTDKITIQQTPNDYCNNHLEKVEVIDGNKLHIEGWVFAKKTPADLSLVDVYIGGVVGSTDALQGERCLANVKRTDVYDAFKSEYSNLITQHGFNHTFTVNARGTYTLYFYAVDQTGTVPINPEFAKAYNVTFTDPLVKESLDPLPTEEPTATQPTEATVPTEFQAPSESPAVNPTVNDIPFEDGDPYFEVADTKAMAGDEVSVDLAIRNNPGITSFSVQIDYPEAVTLKSVEYKTLFSSKATGSNKLKSPFIISWYSPSSENEDKNGIFATLTFKVNEDTKLGDYPISLSYDEENVFDISFSNVVFGTKHGVLTVHDHTAGDINNDGKVNMKDIVLLQQKINGWEVDVNERFADVIGDNKVNMKDIVLLQQFINGWEVDLV